MKHTVKKRTDGDFPERFDLTLTPGEQESALEKQYREELNEFIGHLAALSAADKSQMGPGQAAFQQAKEALRSKTMDALVQDASRFCANEENAPNSVRQLHLQEGRFAEAIERLEASLFVVREKFENGKAVDVNVGVSAEAAGGAVSAEKQKLFVEMSDAVTVVRSCCDRLHKSELKSDRDRAESLRDEYIRKLAGCGRAGLESDQTEMASAALSNLKGDFLALAAGVIKRRASEALGKVALIAGAALVTSYIACRWLLPYTLSGPVTDFLFDRKEFLLLGAGAAIGAWLSFSIRSLDLTFDDLSKVDDELLGPEIRIIFVLMLSLVVGLFFWTHAFSLKVGAIEVGHSITGSLALLVGIFCGLAERALASSLTVKANGLFG